MVELIQKKLKRSGDAKVKGGIGCGTNPLHAAKYT